MEILNLFGVQPVLLAAQVVNFFILLFILKRFLYGPIIKVLEERKQKIAESLENAEKIEKKLAETDEQSEKILAKTLVESQKIIDQSNAAASQIIEDAQKGAVDIINRAIDEAKRFADLEKVKMQQEVRENLVDFVVLVFEKVTGKVLSKTDQKKLIEKEIKNIS